MKNLLRMLLLVGLVVSVTWAASWVTGRGPPTMAALQQGAAAKGSASAPVPPGQTAAESSPGPATATEPAQSGPAASKQAPAPDVTHDEIDAAMKEVEKTLAGGGRDAGEAVAEKPLPVDLAFAIPSDI